MAQTDERRAEDPQRLARFQLRRPVCAIDVTATCECWRSRADAVSAPRPLSSAIAPHTQTRHAGAEPAWRTIRQLNAAIVQQQDTALPRLRCRCNSGWPHHFTPPWPTQKGTCFVNRSMWVRNPPEAPFQSRCFPWCNSSTSLCEGDGAGAEPAGKPNFNIVRKAKKPSQWFASPPYPVQVRGARPLCFRGVRVHARHSAKVEARGASPRGSAISMKVCSLTARASGS